MKAEKSVFADGINHPLMEVNQGRSTAFNFLDVLNFFIGQAVRFYNSTIFEYAANETLVFSAPVFGLNMKSLAFDE